MSSTQYFYVDEGSTNTLTYTFTAATEARYISDFYWYADYGSYTVELVAQSASLSANALENNTLEDTRYAQDISNLLYGPGRIYSTTEWHEDMDDGLSMDFSQDGNVITAEFGFGADMHIGSFIYWWNSRIYFDVEWTETVRYRDDNGNLGGPSTIHHSGRLLGEDIYSYVEFVDDDRWGTPELEQARMVRFPELNTFLTEYLSLKNIVDQIDAALNDANQQLFVQSLNVMFNLMAVGVGRLGRLIDSDSSNMARYTLRAGEIGAELGIVATSGDQSAVDDFILETNVIVFDEVHDNLGDDVPTQSMNRLLQGIFELAGIVDLVASAQDWSDDFDLSNTLQAALDDAGVNLQSLLDRIPLDAYIGGEREFLEYYFEGVANGQHTPDVLPIPVINITIFETGLPSIPRSDDPTSSDLGQTTTVGVGTSGDDVINSTDISGNGSGGTGTEIYSGSGNDTVNNSGNGNGIDTGEDDDTVHDTGTGTVVRLGSGDDTYTHSGAQSGVRIFGEAGNDVLNGGATDDHIDGGDGNDRIDTGGGINTATGGLGADIFVFNTDAESTTITDFGNGADRIDLSALIRGHDNVWLYLETSGKSVDHDLLWARPTLSNADSRDFSITLANTAEGLRLTVASGPNVLVDNQTTLLFDIHLSALSDTDMSAESFVF